MTNPKIAQMALLAEASYGSFQEATPIPDEVKRALAAEDVSQKQIIDLRQNFLLIHHLSNRDSGFSATLFQAVGSDSGTGLTLAIRGTEPFAQAGVDLVQADLGGIVLEGAALYQIVDLYNYWKQLTASSGATVRLARIAETNDPLSAGLFAAVTLPGRDSSFRRIEFFDQANAGLGVINGPVSNVAVTGHSLGGHLATAFQRLFPGIVSEVYTVNGAGTRDSDSVSRFFDVLAGHATSFDAARVSNIYGSAGPNVVSGELVYAQIGGRSQIYTESISDVGGHGGKQMTDSAAVYDLFIRADNRLKMQTAAQLGASLLGVFKAAESDARFTLESVVNAFGRLVLPGYAPIARELADDRDGLHSRIIAIRDALPAAAGDLGVESLVGKSAAQLFTLASTDMAYRYALRELNPFALTGIDYARHNIGGRLDNVDAASGLGLSVQWLQSRSHMLHALLDYNLVDGSINAGAIGGHFEDRPRDIIFGPLDSTTARIVFGGDGQSLVASGSAVGDSLFGASGDDSLSGRAGDDYLEGGLGADTLDGGSGNDGLLGGGGDDTLIAGGGTDVLDGGGGFDSYYAEAGEGRVVIRDGDGAGQVFLSGELVAGGARQSGNSYVSEEGGFKLSFVGDLDAAGTLVVGDALHIENFHNGDLGIVLEGVASSGLPVADFEYSRYSFPDNVAFDDQDPNAAGLYFGSAGNDVFSYGEVDLAFPSIGNDADRRVVIEIQGEHYRGWGGKDVYHGAYHYSDTFFGDGGDDFIFGGDLGAGYVPFEGASDADVLYGGGGRDRIVGGKGNDVLYGDFGRAVIAVFGPGGPADFSTSFGATAADLARLQSVSLDAWSALRGVSPGMSLQVAAEGRTFSGQSLLYDAAAGHGFEAALRDYLGLAYGESIEGFYDDALSGGRGNDRIFGGYGSDTLRGEEGDDFIEGDAPDLAGFRLPPELRVLLGRPGDDLLDGGEGNDSLQDVFGGNDAFYGGAGNDVLYSQDRLVDADADADAQGAVSASYANYLSGGDGNDTLTSYNGSVAGFDYVDGGSGDDKLVASCGVSAGGGYLMVLGGGGDDAIVVSSINGHVDGGEGHDSILVEAPDYDIDAGEQNDTGKLFVFGGAGDDAIFAEGPVDIDGGEGDDTIEWSATYMQTVGGFIRGGAGNDAISVSGPVNVDAGSGDDAIRITLGAGRIITGGGSDSVTICAFAGEASELVLEAGATDALVFERAPGVGASAADLRMQRAGHDLQLDLVEPALGGTQTLQASVRVLGWFAGGASQLASISVEGGRSWSPTEVASIIAQSSLAAGSDEPAAVEAQSGGAIPPPEMADSPARVATLALTPSVLPDFNAVEGAQILAALGAPAALIPAAVVPRVSAVSFADADEMAATDRAEPGQAEDPVVAFLAQLAADRAADFSFTASLQERSQSGEPQAPLNFSRPGQTVAQWSALHAYMDTLASEPDTDQRYAAVAERNFGQAGLAGVAGNDLFPPGVTAAALLGIRDGGLGEMRPLQGLSEGFARLA